MKKRILVKGPVLSQSGYGEQSRFALKSLRSREDKFDIYIAPLSWGKTGWVSTDSEERRWIDEKIAKTQIYNQQGGTYDISLQITIPNEFEKLAPINIGYTAGIETTRVAAKWIQKCNEMDSIIVVSNHAKEVFDNTVYQGTHPQTGQTFELYTQTPITVVNYSQRTYPQEKLNLDLEYNFNYLAMVQWGPRKNVNNLIKWFVEENFDQEVGLVLKASIQNNSLIDREHTTNRLKNILNEHKDMKCKIYLLHGDMSEKDLGGLYRHPKIKAFVSTAHGEGFGLPLFEAACHGMPVIMHGWSGQKDFLYIPLKNGQHAPYFAEVEYDLGEVGKNSIWKDVVEEGSGWAYPREASFKRKLREVRTNYKKHKRKATKLKKHLIENFSEEKQFEKFCNAICPESLWNPDAWFEELNADIREVE